MKEKTKGMVKHFGSNSEWKTSFNSRLKGVMRGSSYQNPIKSITKEKDDLTELQPSTEE